MTDQMVDVKEFDENDDTLSDLMSEDIEDSDISQVDLEELRNIESEAGSEGISKEMLVQMKMAEECLEKENDYSQELVKRYLKEPEKAKAFYYKEKVNFDLDTEKGKKDRDDMLKQYLLGLQWVLYYYYNGV